MKLFSHVRLLVGLLGFFATLTAFGQVTLTSGTQGTAYTYQITTTPAAPAGTLYSATGLPSGVSINASSGLISGTPTASGAFNGTLALVSGSVTNNYTYTLSIAAPVAAPVTTGPSTLSGTVNVAIANTPIVATSGTAITSYNASGLPPGLSVDAATGIISGMPTAAGEYLASISANNAGGTGGSRTLTVTIAAATGTPVISSVATLAGNPGSAISSYTIVASNPPISSYSATGLQAGLSLDTVNGIISGTPVAGGVSTVTLRATNASGTGPAFTLTVTVGTLSSISSLTTANGTVGASFNYLLNGTGTGGNAPTSFNIGTLPAGLSVGGTAAAPIITGTPTVVGESTVSLSANNATGTGPTSTLTIKVVAAPVVTPPVVTPPAVIPIPLPTITAQPSSQSAVQGTTVAFTVSASGSGLTFEWFKNGVKVSGATSSTLTLSNVQSSDVGTYTVTVFTSGGFVSSSGATLAVTPIAVVTAPVINSQPASQAVAAGATVTFTITASGTSPLAYQWRKDGTAIAGATAASLTLANVTAASAGAYSLVVTNNAGTATSDSATLAVTVPPVMREIPGAYFGTFGNNGGTFALLVRGNLTGVFLGYASASRIPLVATNVVVNANGTFSATVPLAGGAVSAASGNTPPTAAHEGEYHIDGTIAASGAVSGTVSTLNLTLSAPAAATTGATAPLAGFYQAGAAGSSANSYSIVGAAGEAFVLTTSGATADAGKGTIDASGNLSVTTAANAAVTGVASSTGIALRATPASGAAVIFAGRNADVAADLEKLVNISTRGQVGAGDNVMIAGFVIGGTQPKSVLIRGIGPSLATFNVTGVLSASRLELFSGATSLAVGNDWGASANATAMVATSLRVSAFPLAANSRDAVLLLTLQPGNYTAVLSGQNGVTGAGMVEVYDATAGSIPNDQRIINIATRTAVGTGDNILIGGFYISGTVPKRVLIRGAGPGLVPLGFGGVLARPQIAIYSGSTVIAQNAGWSTSADAAAISAEGAKVGAFPFPATSQDAAVIMYLAPGLYSAHLTGVGNTTGLALVEVYELP